MFLLSQHQLPISGERNEGLSDSDPENFFGRRVTNLRNPAKFQ